jgi:hypothetical protein
MDEKIKRYWKLDGDGFHGGAFLQSQFDLMSDNDKSLCTVIDEEYWNSLLAEATGDKEIRDNGEGIPIIATIEFSTDELSEKAKIKRDSLISGVEWRRDRYNDELALGLEPTESLQPILEYIQALRDITNQAGFPENIEWPEVPE